jgi:threonyl-tRNA synthetase
MQLDLVMPERFDVGYVDDQDRRRRPALLHRALLGSLERFLGIVLESSGGALPPWLAPEQVLIVPIKAEQRPFSERLQASLAAAGLRCRIDARNESVSRRVRAAHELRIPLVAVIGPREMQAGSVAVRHEQQQRVLPEREAIDALAEICAPPL